MALQGVFCGAIVTINHISYPLEVDYNQHAENLRAEEYFLVVCEK